METQVSIVDAFILKSKYTMLWWWATTRIPLVTQVSDIGNAVRMRPESSVKPKYHDFEVRGMHHHFGVSLCVRSQFHTTWITWLMSRPLLSFAFLHRPSKHPLLLHLANLGVPWHDMLQSRDMTFYGHRLSFAWMDGWMDVVADTLYKDDGSA